MNEKVGPVLREKQKSTKIKKKGIHVLQKYKHQIKFAVFFPLNLFIHIPFSLSPISHTPTSINSIYVYMHFIQHPYTLTG